jgi:hypothetical protein
MYHLKLVKALSFTGIVTATKKNPDVFVEDKATAAAAVATGYFKLLGGTENPDEGREEPPENSGEDNEGDNSKEDGGDKEPGKKLEEMTVPELETFAAYKGISLKGISKKADIIAKLKEELGAAETENEVDYGSPTMTELQGQ